MIAWNLIEQGLKSDRANQKWDRHQFCDIFLAFLLYFVFWVWGGGGGGGGWRHYLACESSVNRYFTGNIKPNNCCCVFSKNLPMFENVNHCNFRWHFKWLRHSGLSCVYLDKVQVYATMMCSLFLFFQNCYFRRIDDNYAITLKCRQYKTVLNI